MAKPEHLDHHEVGMTSSQQNSLFALTAMVGEMVGRVFQANLAPRPTCAIIAWVSQQAACTPGAGVPGTR
jgi:hypothetical protein